MTTLFIVIGCIAGFNALYLFFYVMDDIISQIRKIGKPKNKTTDFTFLDDLDDFEDEPKKPEKPETFEIYDVSSRRMTIPCRSFRPMRSRPCGHTTFADL